MTLSSTITPFVAIPERSEATPGLFNTRFQASQDNLVSLRSDISTNLGGLATVPLSTNTIFPQSGNTVSILSGVFSVVSASVTTASVGYLSTVTLSARTITSTFLSADTVSAASIAVNYITPRSGQTVRFANAQDVVLQSLDSGGAFLNVRSVGAVGDGVTDDAVAFQRAFNSNVTAIYIPAGKYIWGSVVSLPSNKAIFGEGYHTWISAKTTAPTSLLRNTNWPTGNVNLTIRNMRFDGGGSSITSTGLWDLPLVDILSCTSVFMENIWLEHSTGWSLSFSSSSEVHVRNVFVNSNGDGAPGGVDGIHLLDCIGATIDGAYILSGDDCIGVTSQYRNVNDITIRNIVGQSVAANGVIFNEESTTTHSINSVMVMNVTYDGTGNAVRYKSINSSGNTSLSRRAFISNIYGNDITDSVVRIWNVNDVFVGNVFSPRCNTHAVDIQTCNNVAVFNVFTQSAGSTSNDNGVNISTCTQVRVANIFAQKAATWGLQLFGCSRVHATGVFATDCGAQGSGQERGGIRIHNCDRVVLSDSVAYDVSGSNTATGLRISGTGTNIYVGPDCSFSGLSAAFIDAPGIETAINPSLRAFSEASLGFWRSAASTLLLSYGTLGLSHLSIDGSSVVQVGGRRFAQGGGSGDASNYVYSGGAGGLRFMNQADSQVAMKMDDAGALYTVAGSSIYPAWSFLSETSLGAYRSANSTIKLTSGSTLWADTLWSTSGISALASVASLSYCSSTRTVMAAGIWGSGLSIGNATAGGTLIPAISSTSSKIGAFVVQGSSSSFTRVVWAAAQPNDIILVTPTSLGAAVSSLSSGLVAHSHCTVAGQVEMRLSNVSTLVQNQSSITWFLTRISPF